MKYWRLLLRCCLLICGLTADAQPAACRFSCRTISPARSLDSSHWSTVIGDTTVSGGYLKANVDVVHQNGEPNLLTGAGLYGRTYSPSRRALRAWNTPPE